MLFIIITIKFISTEGALGLPMRDMEFVKTFKPPDFQAKNLTPSISPNFNSFSDKTTNKMSEMEKFTSLAKILHCRRH